MTSYDYIAMAAILLIGVPHGGLDGAVARRIGWPMSSWGWITFHLAYTLIAIFVMAIWWLLPLTSLVAFLMISGLHFGASDIKHIDEIGSKRWLPLMAHGGLVPIAIPGFQPEAVLPIFTILVGEPSSAILLRTIDSIFSYYIAIVIAYLLFSSKYNKWRSCAANLVALLVLAYWLPPLISFAIYFCLWHSRSHYARIWRSIALSDRPRCITETIVYSICAWFVAVGFYWYFQMTLNQGLIEITFIGLAALTVPHMLLVDLADSNSNRFKL